MGKSKDVVSKKGKGVRKGIDVTPRPTRPIEPQGRELAIVPLAPSSLRYPFGSKPKFPSKEMSEVYKKFSSKEVMAPHYMNPTVIDERYLGEAAPRIINMFKARGFSFAVGIPPPLVYPDMAKEFLTSFHVDKIHNEDRELVEYYWKFRLGSKDYALGEDDLRKALGIGDNVTSGSDRLTRTEFWKIISGRDETFSAKKYSTWIKDPVWRLVHRIIATCIYMRKDNGRYINLPDLDFMNHLNGTNNISRIMAYATHLEHQRTDHFSGLVLSGGNVATLIAEFVGFKFDRNLGIKGPSLELTTLATMKVIKWHKEHGYSLYGTMVEDEEEAIVEHQEGRESANEQTEHVVPPPIESSDDDEILTLSEIRDNMLNLEEFAVETKAFMKWQERMIGGLYMHLNIPGFEAFRHNASTSRRLGPRVYERRKKRNNPSE